MDVDLLDSSSAAATYQDQMEEMMMMMMMQQIDKLPQFSPPDHDDLTQLPSNNIDFSSGTNCTTAPPMFHNIPALASSFPLVHQDHFATNAFSSSPPSPPSSSHQKKNSMAAMREMIFRIAAMQPIHIDPESVKPPKRRNVKISKDPQSVAARHRRERISERIRILQRLVPGGTKMDTASMLDEAIHYVKFLKTQVQSLELAAANGPASSTGGGVGFPVGMMNNQNYMSVGKGYYQAAGHQVFSPTEMLS